MSQNRVNNYSPTSTAVEYSVIDATVSGALTVMADQASPTKKVDVLSFQCSGDTNVKSLTFDNLQSGFEDFIDLTIDVSGDSQKLELMDTGSNSYTATFDDTLEFGGGIFTLSGEIIGSDPVLVTVTYDTVEDKECTVVRSSTG